MDDLPLVYTERVIELLKNPKNMGEMEDPDGVGNVGNPVCGDIMRIYIKVAKKQGKKGTEYIKDIKFQTLGCGAAIASTSMLTILAKGKDLDEATKITNQDVIKALGGVPIIKTHCSVLAAQGLKKAIEDYIGKTS